MEESVTGTPRTPTRAALPVLVSGLVANAIGQAFLFVLLPPLGRRLGLTDIQTGAILSAAAMMLLVSAPAWGFLSERIGRRPVLLVGLLAAALAPLGFAVAVGLRLDGTLSPTAVLAALFSVRLAQAAASGGLMPAAQAYVADVTAPERRAAGMGLLGASFGLGAMIGAAIAWRIGGTHVVEAFCLVGGLACVALVAAAIFLREPARSSTHVGPAAKPPLAAVWPFFVVTACGVAIYAVVQQVTALRLQDVLGLGFQESVAKAGGAMTATALVMVLVQAFGLRLLKWSPDRLLLVGVCGAAIAMGVLASASTYPVMVAAMIGLGISLGLMFPGNLAAMSVRTGADAQGKVAGLNAIGQGFGSAVGPILGASLHQMSPAMPFIVATAVLACLAAIAAVRVVASPAPRPTEEG